MQVLGRWSAIANAKFQAERNRQKGSELLVSIRLTARVVAKGLRTRCVMAVHILEDIRERGGRTAVRRSCNVRSNCILASRFTTQNRRTRREQQLQVRKVRVASRQRWRTGARALYRYNMTAVEAVDHVVKTKPKRVTYATHAD